MKFSVAGLVHAGLDLQAPFIVDVRLDPRDDIDTDQVAELHLTSVERVLPGRRASGFALCNDQLVFAKLFYGGGARRYWRRELAGAAHLQHSGVTTPEVLRRGALEDGDGYFVFYRALEKACTLEQTSEDDLHDAVLALAQLHDANLVQSDVHMDNFLRVGKDVFTVDADGVRRAHLLRQQFANLGQLFAQRDPIHDAAVAGLWEVYAQSRGEYISKMGSSEMALKVTRDQRSKRVGRYLAKTQRECTEFVSRKHFRFSWHCDREYSRRLQRFVVFAQEVFDGGTLMKAGNSATVARVVIDGERFIVKRYNIKNLLHRLKRWFKRRARNAWCNGHELAFLGIRTARPIALLETSWGWFAGVSYLIMPDCGERHLGEALANDPASFDYLAPQVVALLQGLRAAGLEHGDLKATNFVLSEKELVLIDYDAVRYADTAKDVTRFLANWDQDEALHSRWRQVLSEAGL